jgi:hypothetical protein
MGGGGASSPIPSPARDAAVDGVFFGIGFGPLPRGPVGIREPAGIHADPQVYAAHIPVIHIVPQVNPASFTAFAPWNYGNAAAAPGSPLGCF